jgi:prepilin-type N-terminal cleavage/methylation domain-containing protein
MRKGFTLLELVIVIIVIGILVAMALPQFTTMAERGRIARAEAMLDAYRKAEGIYHALNSVYATQAEFAALSAEVPELLGSDADWTYTISNTDANVDFTVTAARNAGQYAAKTVTINQAGTIGGDHPLL